MVSLPFLSIPFATSQKHSPDCSMKAGKQGSSLVSGSPLLSLPSLVLREVLGLDGWFAMVIWFLIDGPIWFFESTCIFRGKEVRNSGPNSECPWTASKRVPLRAQIAASRVAAFRGGAGILTSKKQGRNVWDHLHLVQPFQNSWARLESI